MTLNWSVDYSKMLWNKITVYHQHDLWISAQDINDNQAEIDIGIKIPLIRDLFTEIKFEWIFDNQPAQGSDKLDNKYSLIQNGEKIKFIYLRTPNPIKENVISFLDYLPTEFGLNKYIDHETQFQKTFLDPIEPILDAIGWSSKEVSTLDEFFG